MTRQLMQASGTKSQLDPRTKLALLLMIAVFVLGGTGGEAMHFFRVTLSLMPFILLLLSGKIKLCLYGGMMFLAGYEMQRLLIPNLSGISLFIVIAISGMITGFIPSIMMGNYVVSTTTVSEFIAAMERMHVTKKITIPLSVMFRFFPTVQEEFSAINGAMRMRGIRFNGKKKGKILEYRIIPIMMCSARIGEELSAAALTRGLGAPIKRTNICQIGFCILDFVMLTLCVTIIVFWIFSLWG